MKTQKNQHVVPYKNGWAVKGDGNSKNTAIVKSKNEAIKIARNLSIKQKSELLIHNKRGEIISRDSHGNDPFPPRG